MTARQTRMPRDRHGARHYCQDETATAVNDRWLCKCLGGPYFTTPNAVTRHQRRTTK